MWSSACPANAVRPRGGGRAPARARRAASRRSSSRVTPRVTRRHARATPPRSEGASRMRTRRLSRRARRVPRDAPRDAPPARGPRRRARTRRARVRARVHERRRRRARDEDDPRAVASGPAGPSPTAARRARDAARAADRYVAEEGDRRGRERTVAETRRTRPRARARAPIEPRRRRRGRPRRPRPPPPRGPRERPPSPLEVANPTATTAPRLGGAKNAETPLVRVLLLFVRGSAEVVIASTHASTLATAAAASETRRRRRERHAPGRAYRGGDGGTPVGRRRGRRRGRRPRRRRRRRWSRVFVGRRIRLVRNGDAGSRYPGADDRGRGRRVVVRSRSIRASFRPRGGVSHLQIFRPHAQLRHQGIGRTRRIRSRARVVSLDERAARRGRREVPPESTHAGESVRRGVRSSPRARRREMLARRDAIRAGRDAHERGCLRRRRGVGSVRELARRIPGVARHGRRGRTA